ncbi:hypothetical protein [Rhizobium leguminosarum]|uniref:hypothetical protein n=1 Tax=Rhizobium leguminosarum TaxID=384 RepID=UPI0004813F85|nr:hypothetical protein [Rhizobium leguminosarum]
MAFEIDNFIDKLASTLAVQGFVETAREIRETIAAGIPRSEDFTEEHRYTMSSREQYDLAAKIIERNIIRPYATWEASVLQLADAQPTEDGTIVFQNEWEELYQVTEGDRTARLGSFDYRKPISRIADLTKRLRGMEPPRSPPHTGAGPTGSGQSGAALPENDEHSRYRRTTRKNPKYDVRVALRRMEQQQPLSGWQEVLVEPKIPRPGSLHNRAKQFEDTPFAYAVRDTHNDD